MTGPLFTADILAEHAVIEEASMLSECELRQPVVVRRPGGISETTYQPIGTERCRVAPVGEPQERLFADRLQGRQGWLVVLPRTAVVRSDYRLHVRGTTAGVPWEKRLSVIGAVAGHSTQTSTRVLCVEVPTTSPASP